MTSPEEANSRGEESLERQVNDLFDTSYAAAQYAEFLDLIEPDEPLVEEDPQETYAKVTKAEAPVVQFIASRTDDPIIKKALLKMIDPDHPVACHDRVDSLIATYKQAYPGLPPDKIVLQDIALFEAIEDIAWHAQLTGEAALYNPKSELQTTILTNSDLDATRKQILLEAVDALVAGEGIDFSDPVAAFIAVEEKIKEEQMGEKRRKFNRQFSALGESYGVDGDPEFSALTIVTGLAVYNAYDIGAEPYIPDGESTLEQLKLLGIPYAVYEQTVRQIIKELDT